CETSRPAWAAREAFSAHVLTDYQNRKLPTALQHNQRSWGGMAWNFSISKPKPMRPSPQGSLRTCTTRAVQRISGAEFPVTYAGMRSVASMVIPTCSGAEDAKKNPPRQNFRVSE